MRKEMTFCIEKGILRGNVVENFHIAESFALLSSWACATPCGFASLITTAVSRTLVAREAEGEGEGEGGTGVNPLKCRCILTRE